MNTEEKAKRYDEAIERAKGVIEQNPLMEYLKKGIEYIFPELKESDDEKIRKELVNFFSDKDESDYEGLHPRTEIIAWLEKQGEHANFRNKIQICDKVTRNEDGVLVNLSQLNRVAKKKGEQKPAESNDIEGILLVHDEILNNLLERYKTSATFKTLIVNLKNWWNNTRRHLLSFNTAWSEEDGRKLLEIKCLIGNYRTGNDEYELCSWIDKIKDRVQPKQEWSEKCIADVFEKVGLAKIVREQENDSLTRALQSAMIELAKYSVVPQIRQEWSEEDKKMLESCCGAIAAADYYTYDDKQEMESWLKSIRPQNGYNPYKEVVESIAEMCKHYDKASHSGLRDFYDNVKVKCKDAKEYDSLYPQNRWKPSDLQLECLSDAIKRYNSQGYDAPILKELLNELSKLKG